MKVILWETLSKTFREAIHTTRKLGFRYIWIDSLCIIQDDDNDWSVEAATMCDVYQHAALTIAAAHATGGNIGCFADRDGLLKLPFYVDISSRTSPVMPVNLHFTTYGRSEMKELGGGNPVLYGRAWVLQEQLLSRRSLIFDGTQLKWDCLTMHGTEKSPTSGTTRFYESYRVIRSAIMEDHDIFATADGKEQQELNTLFWPRVKIVSWAKIIEDYTHRGITKSSDRLVALAGIGQALSRHSEHHYMAGLWSINLFLGLLWSLPHYDTNAMSAETNFDVENNLHIRHEKLVAPSWSWASVTAPVMYGNNTILNDRICEISNVQVSGSIAKQAGQVTIRGHVRTGYVNAVYPYTIREAAAKVPNMTAPPPAGRMGLESMTFQERSFHPDEYFLFSDRQPGPNGFVDLAQLHRKGSFRFVRGTFRPDELISPSQELTFIAIAQVHRGANLSSRLSTRYDHDPVRVRTLALVRTEDEGGTYRRVGLAVWDDCAWYGYLCGWKEDLARRITTPREWKDGFRVKGKATSWMEKWRKLWWDDMELYECTERVGGDGPDGRWKHQHEYQGEQLPDLRMYKEGIKVQEKTVVIV
ncbi:hypothetical protein E8E13_001043 [Curvularia kusanoi]|uniref:Heterokaryon incompatibility domain-containing protein n=1 Tax=Curvularia kusanoi TaxID=90978 RepID=A0A9P4TFV6_CURKU|nr:hypothetical protein E8E13_001043 [Curvularia kusanoi]